MAAEDVARSTGNTSNISSGDNVPNLREIHDFLITLAYRAGDIIASALPVISGTDSKMNSQCVLKWIAGTCA